MCLFFVLLTCLIFMLDCQGTIFSFDTTYCGLRELCIIIFFATLSAMLIAFCIANIKDSEQHKILVQKSNKINVICTDQQNPPLSVLSPLF